MRPAPGRGYEEPALAIHVRDSVGGTESSDKQQLRDALMEVLERVHYQAWRSAALSCATA